MIHKQSSRANQHFARNTAPGMRKTWLILSAVLLVACVSTAQTTPPTRAPVKLTRATPILTRAAKASPVATNAPPEQARNVLQVQPLRSSTNGFPQVVLKEPKANEVTVGQHTYSGIVVQIIKAKNPLQLLNPAAPAEYGSAWDNLEQFTISGNSALKLFSFSF
jgi:hypothetical protein